MGTSCAVSAGPWQAVALLRCRRQLSFLGADTYNARHVHGNQRSAGWRVAMVAINEEQASVDSVHAYAAGMHAGLVLYGDDSLMLTCRCILWTETSRQLHAKQDDAESGDVQVIR